MDSEINEDIDPEFEPIYRKLLHNGRKFEANIIKNSEIHYKSEDIIDQDEDGVVTGVTVYDIILIYNAIDEIDKETEKFIAQIIRDSLSDDFIRNIYICNHFIEDKRIHYPSNIENWLRKFRNQFRRLYRFNIRTKPYFEQILNVFSDSFPYIHIFLYEVYEEEEFSGFELRIYSEDVEDKICKKKNKISYPCKPKIFPVNLPAGLTEEDHLDLDTIETVNHDCYLKSIETDTIILKRLSKEYPGSVELPKKEFKLKSNAFHIPIRILLDEIVEEEEKKFFKDFYKRTALQNIQNVINLHPKKNIFKANWVNIEKDANITLWFDFLQYENALFLKNWREVFVKMGTILEYLMILYGNQYNSSETVFTGKNPKLENMINYTLKNFASNPNYFFGNPILWSNVQSITNFRNMIHTKSFLEWRKTNIDFQKNFKIINIAFEELLNYTQ